MRKVGIKLALTGICTLASFIALGQFITERDTLFKWKNLRPVTLGFEAGAGYFKTNQQNVNNFDHFSKIEFGLRVYVKKIVFGWRGGFLQSNNKNAGNVDNVDVNGQIENRQSSMFVGFLMTSPKHISLEPAIFYSINRGLLFLDSLDYGKYFRNEPIENYRVKSFGFGLNSYINLNTVFPKVFRGFPIYVYTQVSFQIPTQRKISTNELLQNYSIGLTLFPFFYKSNHF